MAKLTLGQDEDNFYKQIQLDYGKTKKDVEEYVDILMKWSQEQPHFPEIPPINGVLLYIVGCKFSIEKAKEKLDMYYTVRLLMPEIFTKHPLSPDLIMHSKIAYVILLPKVTSDQHRLIYFHVNPDFDPEHFTHEQFFTQFIHVLELIFLEDKCYNFHMIYDCNLIKMGHLSRFSPMVVKRLGICLEKVYATRIKKIYLVHFYPFLENILNTVFKPFLPEKLRNKIKVYEGIDILFKDFDKSILPKDIGGNEKSLEELRVMMLEKYEGKKSRFDKIQYMTVDESLRPHKLKNDDILGYYGSFKQISVD